MDVIGDQDREGRDGQSGTATVSNEQSDSYNLFNSFVVGVNSLFAQFKIHNVRSDFSEGRFDMKINPNIMLRLDTMSCVLFPRWSASHSLYDSDVATANAVDHLRSLYNKSSALFRLDGFERDSTYADWFNMLNMIAEDSYWNEITPDQRCTHRSENHSESKLYINQGVKPKLKKESKSSSSESFDSEESGSDDYHSTDESHLRDNLGKSRKEVVVPPKFNMYGATDIKVFLRVFESYFSKKFQGSEYDKTQELSNFIDGKLLDVYNIRGGRKLKYSKMKKELVTFFEKQEIGGKKYWREKFHNENPSRFESLDLYGMRLVEIFQVAYPRIQTERSEDLKDHFLNTIPGNIAEKVRDAMRLMRATSGSRKNKIKFSTIVEMAHDLQQDCPKQVSWLGSDQILPQSVTKTSKKLTTSEEICSYCKKGNHTVSQCWRQQGKCLICGNEHKMESCPRFTPNRTSLNLNE